MKPALRIVCSIHSRTIAVVLYEDGRAMLTPSGSTTSLYRLLYEDGRAMLTAGSLDLGEVENAIIRGKWCRRCDGEHAITVGAIRRALSRRDGVMTSEPLTGIDYRAIPGGIAGVDDVLTFDD